MVPELWAKTISRTSSAVSRSGRYAFVGLGLARAFLRAAISPHPPLRIGSIHSGKALSWPSVTEDDDQAMSVKMALMSPQLWRRRRIERRQPRFTRTHSRSLLIRRISPSSPYSQHQAFSRSGASWRSASQNSGGCAVKTPSHSRDGILTCRSSCRRMNVTTSRGVSAWLSTE